MKKRKIAIITGTRAEFGVISSIILQMKKSDLLDSELIVTGMHLQKKHGYTLNEIRSQNFKIDYVVKIIGTSESHVEISKSIGRGIIKLTNLFNKIKPHLVFITGDRTEQLAATIAAANLRIPIAHYVGGERTKGGIDESIRHAISKFANLHFVKTNENKERLIKLGEKEESIFVVGFSGLDFIYAQKLFSRNFIEHKFNLKSKERYVIVLQHSVSSESHEAKKQINETLKAVSRIPLKKILIYPNADPGSREIINEIDNYVKKDNSFKAYKNLNYKLYLSLLRFAEAILGNSSGPTVETIPFKIPVINIGIRQNGRERGINVIDVVHDETEIFKAYEKSQSLEFKEKLQKIKNPFGNGTTSEKIVQILESIPLDDELIKKQITY